MEGREPFTPKMMMKNLRDHYEGTPQESLFYGRAAAKVPGRLWTFRRAQRQYLGGKRGCGDPGGCAGTAAFYLLEQHVSALLFGVPTVL